jgi:hypothetical protein
VSPIHTGTAGSLEASRAAPVSWACG